MPAGYAIPTASHDFAQSCGLSTCCCLHDAVPATVRSRPVRDGTAGCVQCNLKFASQPPIFQLLTVDFRGADLHKQLERAALQRLFDHFQAVSATAEHTVAGQPLSSSYTKVGSFSSFLGDWTANLRCRFVFCSGPLRSKPGRFKRDACVGTARSELACTSMFSNIRLRVDRVVVVQWHVGVSSVPVRFDDVQQTSPLIDGAAACVPLLGTRQAEMLLLIDSVDLQRLTCVSRWCMGRNRTFWCFARSHQA
jgi:hypothetical protein